MRHAVTWTPSAQQQLAAVWMASTNRASVTGAAHAIDMLLAVDADQRGVPNFDTVRTLVHAPLGVDFEVVDDDRIVYVLTVWELP